MQKFENFFSSTLTTGIDAEASSITVEDVTGLSLETGETYQAALQKPGTPDPEIEIVTITALSGNNLTIVRGQETTTATTFSIGDLCEIRLTAGGLNAMLQRSEVLDEDDFATGSEILPPSQQSTAAYITSYVANLDPFTFKDGLDAATNPDLPAGDAGDTYKITSNGTVSGVAVQSGDTAICTVDATAANTPANWIFGQGNIEQATPTEAEAGTDDAKYLTPAMGRLMARAMFGLGHIQMSANPTSPDTSLWLPCNGETIGRAGSGATYTGDQYKDLYDAIQTTYDNPNLGASGVSGTYNWAGDGVVYLPNQQGLVPRGTGSQSWTADANLKDGWTLGTYSEDQMQNGQVGWTDGTSSKYSIIQHNYGNEASGYNAGHGRNLSLAAYLGSTSKLEILGNNADGEIRKGATTRDSSISYNFYILY